MVDEPGYREESAAVVAEAQPARSEGLAMGSPTDLVTMENGSPLSPEHQRKLDNIETALLTLTEAVTMLLYDGANPSTRNRWAAAIERLDTIKELLSGDRS